MKRALTITAALSISALSWAFQDRLSSMPGFQTSREVRPKMQSGLKLARATGSWISGHEYAAKTGDEWTILDAKTLKTRTTKEDPRPLSASPIGRRGPGRGRQFDRAISPDGRRIAHYVNGNIIMSAGDMEVEITKDGDLSKRVKYGSGSWVYGEELGQNEAMGFDPTGTMLWAYRFDESQVRDYHIVQDNARTQSRLEVEAYPKPGQPNPMVDLYIFNVENGEKTIVNVRPGLFDEGIGHYVYNIRWSPDGSALLFYRTDRRQKVVEFCSANPQTGDVKVLWHEENPGAWVENFFPTVYFAERDDAKNASDLTDWCLFLSEQTGWTNYYLLNWKTGESRPITRHSGFDVRGLVRLDLASKTLYYMAANGDRPSMGQLNKIGLDGGGHKRLTDPKFDHDALVSSEGWIIDTAQSIESPPEVRLLDPNGQVKQVLEKSDVSSIAAHGYQQPEHFSYLAADGKTMLHGVIHKPYNFDPNKKYPALLSVYGGPGGPMSDSFSERYRSPSQICDYGFILLEMENRGTGGRGREFKNALYQNMGFTEIDDIAGGIKTLWDRPWFDKTRVGLYGTSYGGYFAFMSLFRHPDVYAAASSSAGPSDWRNYDTIYTERYMGILPESKDAYDRSSVIPYAKDMKGWLMIYYGSADDNVHPANVMQVIKELQRLGKSFEVQVGVDAGHSGLNQARMLEFFIERLMITGPR